MTTAKQPARVDSLTSLTRGVFLLVAGLACAVVVAPFVFRAMQHLPALADCGCLGFLPDVIRSKTAAFAEYLSEQPFRRVFNRVAVVAIVGALALGWRWLGISFEFRPLLKRKRAVGRYVTWFIVGALCIGILVYAQVYAGMRIPRDKGIKLFSALLSAVTVGFLEECFFRGFVLQAFLKRIARYKAILVTSAAFALVHLFSLNHFLRAIKASAPDGAGLLDGVKLMALFFAPLRDPALVFPGLIGLFLAGWLLAELTVRTRSLWPAIGLHSGWVFAIKVLGKIWKYPKDTAPSWFFGEKYAATGALGWLVIGILILAVNGLLVYMIYRAIVFAGQLLSHRKAVALGRTLGRLGYYLSPSHRHLALENIHAAFPDKSSDECARIARQSFETFGVVCIEFLVFEKLSKDFFNIVHPRGMEHIEQAAAQGHGIIFFTGHFGSWELLALGCASFHYPFTGVARPYNNEWIYRHIQKVRLKSGLHVLDKKGIVRDVLLLLRANEMVGFVGDQYAGSGGLFVEFLGRPASTTSAMATFARKTGACLIPAFDHILADGTHHPVIHPPIEAPRTEDTDKDVFEVTQQLMRILEQEIRDDPGMWLWAQRKWRKKKKRRAH